MFNQTKTKTKVLYFEIVGINWETKLTFFSKTDKWIFSCSKKICRHFSCMHSKSSILQMFVKFIQNRFSPNQYNYTFESWVVCFANNNNDLVHGWIYYKKTRWNEWWIETRCIYIDHVIREQCWHQMLAYTLRSVFEYEWTLHFQQFGLVSVARNKRIGNYPIKPHWNCRNEFCKWCSELILIGFNFLVQKKIFRSINREKFKLKFTGTFWKL